MNAPDQDLGISEFGRQIGFNSKSPHNNESKSLSYRPERSPRRRALSPGNRLQRGSPVDSLQFISKTTLQSFQAVSGTGTDNKTHHTEQKYSNTHKILTLSQANWP